MWHFLHRVRAAFCPLYQRGYTSLGARSTTRPNSALLQPDGSYLPAWALQDGAMEREGRAAELLRASGPT